MNAVENQNNVIGYIQTNTFGDVFFSSLNGNTFNKIDSEHLFKQHFSKLLFDAYKLYVIVGTDSGLLPRFIENQGIPDGTRYLFIEPSAVLQELQKNNACFHSGEYFSFADETNWVEALATLKATDYFFINSVHSQTALCAKEDSMGFYTELAWNVNERLQQLNYQTNLGTATQPFLIQQLLNLADNHSSLLMLKQAFQGKTAFVLGGGTSLDSVLPWLIEHRSYIVIIAVSRISKRLLSCGVEPDFICSVDPFPINWEVSKEMHLLGSKAIFIYAYHVYHRVLAQWSGPSLYCGKRVPWESSLNEQVDNMPGPTVTNSAIYCAVLLGFSHIYLAGVDYCYSLDGFSHAQGSIEASVGARFNLSGITTETYQGVMAPTNLAYLFARDCLENQIKQYSMVSSSQFYNVAPMAAKISNISYCSLDSVLLDKKVVNVTSMLDTYISVENVNNFLKKSHKEVQQSIHQIKEIKNLAQEAYQCNESLYNAQGFIENYKDKLHLDKIERIINKKYKKFSRLVKEFGIRQFLKIIKPFGDLEKITAEEIQYSLRVYYQSYIDGSNALIQLLETAEKNINARIEERKTRPDWDFLIDYARKEHCYGRVKKWRQLESSQQLNLTQQEAFNELEQLFKEEIEKTPSYTQVAKKATSLTYLNSRAQILFKHNQKELLCYLLLALDNHHDPKGVIPYRYLIQGYIAELNKNNEEAIDAYSHVIHLNEGPLEEALLRIVNLNLEADGNSDLAHQALECLSVMSPRYLSFYAESCRLRGAIVEAIEAYLQHIATFPNDVITQLKCAQLYLDQNIIEGAELMLNHILEAHPENEIALQMKRDLHQ